MAKNRSHGKIDKLPPNLRMEVNRRLIKGDTYAKISEYLKSLGHDISLASVFRYGRPFLKEYEAVKRARQAAEFIIKK